MKLSSYLLVLFSSFSLCAETIQMRPLWQEDAHFIHYRCLMIQGSISRLQTIVNSLEDPECKAALHQEIDAIKLNIGIPITLDH